ncbi:MAG: hypothetical protein U0793_16480 [Gemmataceae bacterium]
MPDALVAAIHKCSCRNPANRYKDIAGFREPLCATRYWCRDPAAGPASRADLA